MTRREFLKLSAQAAIFAAAGSACARAASLTIPSGGTLNIGAGTSVAVTGSGAPPSGDTVPLGLADFTGTPATPGGFARVNDTVSTAVPFADTDLVTDPLQVGVFAAGVAIPCQTRVLSRWGLVNDPTRPIRTLLTHFKVASLAGMDADATTYEVRPTGQITNADMLTDNTTYWTVQTGPQARAGSMLVDVYKTGSGHNIFKKAQISDGTNWVTVMADANASGLYLKGVATSEDAKVLRTGTVPSFAALAGKTITFLADAVTYTYTFSSDPSYFFAWWAVNHFNNAGSPTGKIRARMTTDGASLEFVGAENGGGQTQASHAAKDAQNFSVTGGTAVTEDRLGGDFAPGVVPKAAYRRINGQNADYLSNQYLPGDAKYQVQVEERGGELVVLRVLGKFGVSGSEFKGMNDETGLSELFAGSGAGLGDAYRQQWPLKYEVRYHFYRQAAANDLSGRTIGIETIWKNGGAHMGGGAACDAAIKNGGLRFVLNWSGSGTKVAMYDSTAANKASETTWTAGTKQCYQEMDPRFNSGNPSNNFSIGPAGATGFTFTGSPTKIDEGWFVVGKSDGTTWAALHTEFVKEKTPYGFFYDGTNAEVRFWPSQRGHIQAESFYTPRTYHIMAGSDHHRMWSGITFGLSYATAINDTRAAWSRLIRHPLVPHCGSKYRTSQAIGFLPPPATVATLSGVAYKCISEHMATDVTKPGVGGSWATKWAVVSGHTWARPWVKGRCYGILYRSDAEWDEAFDRRCRWALVGHDPDAQYSHAEGTGKGQYGPANSNRTMPAQWESLNASALQYTPPDVYKPQDIFYTWKSFGQMPRAQGCASNGYEVVGRMAHTWMVHGDPQGWEMFRIHGDHMLGPCTAHDDVNTTVYANIQYSEVTGNNYTILQGVYTIDNSTVLSGQIHGQYSITDFEYEHLMYRPLTYMITGIPWYKDMSQMLIDSRLGNQSFFQDNQLGYPGSARATDPALDGQVYNPVRMYSWLIEFCFMHFRMTGDPIPLREGRNLLIHALYYTDQVETRVGGITYNEAQALSADAKGGQGYASTETPYQESTFAGYTCDASVDMLSIAQWAFHNGYGPQFGSIAIGGQPAYSGQSDFNKAEVSVIQNARSMLMGADSLSPNLGTPAERGIVARPIYRGGDRVTVPGQVNRVQTPFQWRFAEISDGKADSGYVESNGTATSGMTCSVTGATVTTSISIGWPNETYNQTLVFTVAGEPTQARRIMSTSHVGGVDTLKQVYLESAYHANYPAGTSCVFTPSGIGGNDNMSDYHDAWAMSAVLWRARGRTDIANATRARIRETFINEYLYSAGGIEGNWFVYMPLGERGTIDPGSYTFNNERIWGWHAWRGENFYLFKEMELQSGGTF